jgi:hypothetical protein
MRAADLMASPAGTNNPHCVTVSDAERIARAASATAQRETMMTTRCIHGFLAGACATCLPAQRPTRVPIRRAQVGRASSLEPIGRYDAPVAGFVVVHTSRGRSRCGVEAVNEETTHVHIDGGPFLWTIQEILARGPRVKTIQVIPSMYAKVRGGLALCAARGVSVVQGHHRPELRWAEHRIISPEYEAQRKFMRWLSGTQRAEFNELIALGFEQAEIAARYYCLSDEAFMPQRLLAREYGYPEGSNAAISVTVLAVLYYLDDSVEVGDASRRRAQAMRQQVGRLRPYLASAAARQRLLDDLGVSSLAADFPLARADVLRGILAAQRDGRLAALEVSHPKHYRALALRFGLDEAMGVYRKLEEVGKILGFTRERARQLEERALGLLNIADA